MSGAFDDDAAAVRLDGPFGYRQSESGAAHLARTSFVDAIEAVEDALAMLGGNAWSLIDDREDRVRAIEADANLNRRSLRAVLDRVVDDVGHRIAEDQP